MKKILIILAIAVVVGGCLLIYQSRTKNNSGKSIIGNNKILNMRLESPAFKNGEKIPAKYTCDGEDISPPLKFIDVPDKAKSLALIVDDPDAPMGVWVHWVVWNIDPSSKEIAENELPSGGVEGITSFGRSGYGGPCPPSGSHRYFFKLYALDTFLDLEPNVGKEELEKAMEGHILAKAELVGLYR